MLGDATCGCRDLADKEYQSLTDPLACDRDGMSLYVLELLAVLQ